MIIADTSGLLAFFNSKEANHLSVAQVIEKADQAIVVSPYVIAELDYLLANRFGVDVELNVLSELSSGAYELASINTADLFECSGIIQKYSDQNIGITDASLVFLAERYETNSILTLDVKHFSVMKTKNNKSFEILN